MPTDTQQNKAQLAALIYRAAGLSVIPIKGDGSKRPDLDEWTPYQKDIASEQEIKLWFGNGKERGVGIVGGKVSGNLEHLDFDEDSAEVFPAWCALVEAECPGLMDRLAIRTTPREPPGYHVSYRCPEVEIPGNTKLAEKPDAADPEKKRLTVIETRGEGGQVLAPGCPPCCHRTGRLYQYFRGPKLSQVKVISAAEREILWRCAQSFDRMPKEKPHKPSGFKMGCGLSPGDDYNARGPGWVEILSGWKLVLERNGKGYWRRPGKEGPGWSATTGCQSKDGKELFCVFSSNAYPFPGPSNGRPCSAHDRFGAYAYINHAGDFEAAAKELAKQGYGEQKKPRSKDKADDEDDIEAADDPHRLARLFLADYQQDQALTIHQYREEWFEYTGAAFRTLAKDEVKARLSCRIKEEFDRLARIAQAMWEQNGGCSDGGKPPPKPVARKVTVRLVGDVMQALAGLSIVPAAVQAPAWLLDDERSQPWNPGDLLVCQNRIVNLPALVNGDKTYAMAPTPRLFSVNALDYGWSDCPPQPSTWLDFLHKTWAKDTETIATLAEWFGYCLLPDTSQQKILMLIGPKRSGKGTIARVLRGLVGIHNTAGPTLASLGTNFGLWPLLGKALAIISDARLSHRSDLAIITERLLSISGEDAITIDRKNLSPVTCQLAARFMLITNELPRLSDPSGALVGRLIVLRLTESWYGREDPGLTTRLLGELPGILKWSIDGYARLRARGRFLQPKSSLKLITDLEDLSSPVGAFVRECCTVRPDAEEFRRDMYGAWKSWCEEKGQKDPGENVFGRDLRAAVLGLDDRHPTGADGKRVRVYIGIRLKRPEDEPPDREPGEDDFDAGTG